MRIGNYIILPWDRHNFIPRLVVIGLFVAWLAWGLVLFKEGREIEAKIQARQMERQRQEERLRRRAAYEQSRIQEQLNKNASRNALDGAKR